MGAYYNEIDAYAAQWLRNLITKGLIPEGDVDERSICDVAPEDLRGYAQCHFFAGIGGWAHALRLAGWADDRPIWTGSCPCQPFSVAGKGLGADDPRHLWPHFFRLISAARPPVVMGEQVAGAAGYGWFDGVAADLESEDYASRAVDVPACAVNAPHIRSRLYWVASDMGNADRAGGASRIVVASRAEARSGQFVGAGVRSDMDDADDARLEGQRRDGDGRSERAGEAGSTPASGGGHMADATEIGRGRWSPSSRQQAGAESGVEGSSRSDMADAQIIGREERERKDGQQDAGSGCEGGMDFAGTVEGHMADADKSRQLEPIDGSVSAAGMGASQSPGDSGFWSNAIWLAGADGKARRAEPTIPLLAHGVPARVGRLRAYGNAIVPQVAAEVIGAYLDTET